jgi:hypothetical protein
LVKFNSWAAPQEALYGRVLQVTKPFPDGMEGDEQIVALVLTLEHSQLQLQPGIDRIPRTFRGSARNFGRLFRENFLHVFLGCPPRVILGFDWRFRVFSSL